MKRPVFNGINITAVSNTEASAVFISRHNNMSHTPNLRCRF